MKMSGARSTRTSPGQMLFSSAACRSSCQKSAIFSAAPNRAASYIVLGGSAVSSSPEAYPEFDYLHLGEIGDATDELIATLNDRVEPPPVQRRFETREWLPLSSFPLPLYDAVPLARYLIGSLQFSSGCPYRCEFCDIPALYRRQPRFKSPEQLLTELDAFVSQPDHPPVIYLVDDNFIGNRKAARDLLPHLIDWRKRACTCGCKNLPWMRHEHCDHHAFTYF
jgi:radical SAM superfamily enzyme YgiQ (UPF0313 family)